MPFLDKDMLEATMNLDPECAAPAISGPPPTSPSPLPLPLHAPEDLLDGLLPTTLPTPHLRPQVTHVSGAAACCRSPLSACVPAGPDSNSSNPARRRSSSRNGRCGRPLTTQTRRGCHRKSSGDKRSSSPTVLATIGSTASRLPYHCIPPFTPHPFPRAAFEVAPTPRSRPRPSPPAACPGRNGSSESGRDDSSGA